jgi:DnaJ-class molecular chaperone
MNNQCPGCGGSGKEEAGFLKMTCRQCTGKGTIATKVKVEVVKEIVMEKEIPIITRKKPGRKPKIHLIAKKEDGSDE